ncbi:MAG: phospholipid carrier-dependent glycosyltransferase [Sphingomonadales bacterium]|nr:MAG: phospholipid carrier-dependent glycosyltransferase [Sphingomonadales bacterium]
MLDRIKALRTRPWIVALLVGLAAQLLFTVHLDRPSRIMFDEVHYVPAAQALIDLEAPRNIEHPLVAKELIAAGMMVFGDNPIGWRITASFAGTATVLGIFAFLWLLTGSMRASLVGAALAMLNQTIFIQARTAMLDVYLGAFLIWGIVVMLWSMQSEGKQVQRRWIGAAMLFGLAVGVKWAAIPYVAFAGITFLVIRARDARIAKKPLATALSGKDQRYWSGLPAVRAMLLFGGVSILTYFVTFLPAFFYARDPLDGIAGLIALQSDMYALQTQALRPHTYQSSWWQWPLMLRPIWYFYEWDNGAQRGVLLIGNPIVMWGGLLAVLACYWAWFKEKAIVPLSAALLWTISLLIYIVIPKTIGFYYYYHMSGIFLCIVLAIAFQHFDRGKNRGREEWFAAIALVAFVYFYPIIAASPLSDAQSFRHWMWFPSWA